MCKRLRYLALLFFCTASLYGQMTPAAPVKNFRFPRFGENGYTQWVLQGGRGIYDSAAQIRVEAMALRVYSGDERMALEMTMESPSATLRIEENRAFSDSPIRISGANFEISGTGWSWDGQTKEIVVKTNVVVKFTQALSETLSGSGVGPADSARQTEIRSEQLVLQTTETEYRFEFTEEVRALSDEMDLRSNLLIVLADAPEGRQGGDAPKIDAGQADAVRQVVARDAVVIKHGDRVVHTGEAEFYPHEGRAVLTHNPRIEVPGAFLSGHRIHSREGELVIFGGDGEGRAQMILSRAGGLGIEGSDALGAETIALADTITLREMETTNRFDFEGSVDVMSGAVQMVSDTMTIHAAQSPSQEDGEADAAVRVGAVRNLVAEGGVRIEQDGQVATSDRVIFHPLDERAELIGDPRVTNGEAVVTGRRMELKPGLAIVTGDAGNPVVVTLPPMPDLGYTAFAAPESDGSVRQADDPEAGVAPADTVVHSQTLRMVEAPTHTMFRFTDAVQVTGTNLNATCDVLEVTARESGERERDRGKSGDRLEVEKIEAFTHVVIEQAGRTATGDKAIILPAEGRLILEGSAVVKDDRGTVTGHRMTLLQGERRAIVEGGGPDGDRAKVTLPELPGRD